MSKEHATSAAAAPSCQILRISTRSAYEARINRAVEHVRRHLAEPLLLADVARAAALSPFHFHRVFQALVGETLADHVKRLRLERALARMAGPGRPTLAQIALECGFATASDFSRSFKQRYGVAPSAFDLEAWRAAHRAPLQAVLPRPAAAEPRAFDVRLVRLPARTLAYIRVRDPYRGDAVLQATRRLAAWAEREGLAGQRWYGYQWEHPEITRLEDCQYHVAVEAEGCEPRGEIGRARFPPLLVAEVELRGDLALELSALQGLYGSWLPRSGHLPDDHPGFEAWIGHPLAQSAEHLALHLQLPVKPLRAPGRARATPMQARSRP